MKCPLCDKEIRSRKRGWNKPLSEWDNLGDHLTSAHAKYFHVASGGWMCCCGKVFDAVYDEDRSEERYTSIVAHLKTVNLEEHIIMAVLAAQ